ncbi:leucine-rich repeat domain-containing protein [Prevotella pallens]|uniref:leucine-rich repeat domain-containing protein n=1 Tax=Prevotella pallens TaxID=60133 RepID=UPI003C7C3AE1
MKKLLLILLCCYSIAVLAREHDGYTPERVDFRETDEFGNTCLYQIIDATNNYVMLMGQTKRIPTASERSTFSKVGNKTTLPGKIVHNGITYQVKRLCFFADNGDVADTLVISEGVEQIGGNWYSEDGMIWTQAKYIYLPKSLKHLAKYSFGECWNTYKYLGLENTQLLDIRDMAFNQNGALDVNFKWKLPSTLKYLGNRVFTMNPIQHEFELPESLDTLGFDFVYNVDTYKTTQFDYMKVIKLNRPTPPILLDIRATPSTENGFTYYNFERNTGLFSYQEITAHYNTTTWQRIIDDVKLSTPDSLYTPVDATALYQRQPGWDMYKGKYYERVKIGATGYRTYYLQNENFVVPTGCTAYVITGTTPSGNIANPDQANVVAYAAGKIIPKQTGFILKGAVNSSIVYSADATGTEETISTNFLIGTATEQEFSGTGYKYYVLANGDQGLGFYKQGTRNGASMKIGAHQAGLRLPESIARGAKSFIVDFDGAREATEAAGISTVAPNAKPNADVIYDLQGRRVVNPTHGIYIINGKKVIK